VQAILNLPTAVTVAAMTPSCQTKVTAGVIWANAATGTPVNECVGTVIVNGVSLQYPMVVQYCTYFRLKDGALVRSANTATQSRCLREWDSLPGPKRLEIVSRTASQAILAQLTARRP
jgi:hypothetical protein